MCRFEMGLAESDQRAIDRFWGLPTDSEKKRRLAEFLRKQFELRIRKQRAMMVAVGGKISVGKNFAREVPSILGVEKFRIKTMQVTPQEACEDPLGLRRASLGQR